MMEKADPASPAAVQEAPPAPARNRRQDPGASLASLAVFLEALAAELRRLSGQLSEMSGTMQAAAVLMKNKPAMQAAMAHIRTLANAQASRPGPAGSAEAATPVPAPAGGKPGPDLKDLLVLLNSPAMRQMLGSLSGTPPQDP